MITICIVLGIAVLLTLVSTYWRNKGTKIYDGLHSLPNGTYQICGLTVDGGEIVVSRLSRPWRHQFYVVVLFLPVTPMEIFIGRYGFKPERCSTFRIYLNTKGETCVGHYQPPRPISELPTTT